MLILIVIVLVNGLLGLLILARNTYSLTNRLFFILATSTVLWMMASYFTDNAGIEQRIIWGKLAFIFPIFVTVSLAFLSKSFPVKQNISIRDKVLILMVALSVIALCVTNLIVKDIKVLNDGTAIIPGSFYSVYIVIILGFFLYAIKNFITRKGKFSQSQAIQARLVIGGFIASFMWVLTFNVLLPLVIDSWNTTKLGPAGTIIFVSTTAYAIVKHKLFDIKRAVTRSVAYLLSLGFIALIYGLIIFALSSLFANGDFDHAERVFYVFLAIISAIIFDPTKQFFDKLTNKIFYRDAYDPETFLNELNDTAVENIELGILLRHTTKVIQDNIKSRFCYVKIEGTSTTRERLIGTGDFELSDKDNETLKEELAISGRQTIVTDELGSDLYNLREVLTRNEIGILVRLLPGGDLSKEAMYYLILGEKKSGNVYNDQDKRILEIIADEMLIAVQNSLRFEEIEQFNVTLQQKVNDATYKLQRTNKKLRELDETKDEFISMASHQLRTPLTSVKGYMSMVLEGDAGKITKQQRDLLNQAFVSSQRMVYLIADLLNVSRLKTGKFVIEESPTNLSEVIEGEIDQLKETAKSKSIDIEYKKPKDFPTLSLDETKIRQVIMNFSDNAIYYTPRGGKVKVELSEDKSNVYFKVVDNGMGVPKTDRPHLFTKFYRASNARQARPDGTGLGLFMAKKVIDNQGGNILFESEEGKGSTFGFCFEKKKHLLKKHS